MTKGGELGNKIWFVYTLILEMGIKIDFITCIYLFLLYCLLLVCQSVITCSDLANDKFDVVLTANLCCYSVYLN